MPLTPAVEEQVARKYLTDIDPSKPWMVMPLLSPDGIAIVNIQALVHRIFEALKAEATVAVTGVTPGPGATTGMIV